MARTPDVLRAPAIVMILASAVASSCDRPAPTESASPASPAMAAVPRPGGGPSWTAGEHGPDVALDWFRLSYDLTRQQQLSPPVAARAFAYIGVTLYESIVPGSAEYQSLAGQLTGLGAARIPRGGPFHWPAVANAAVAAIMRELYDTPASHAAIAQLEASFDARFRDDVPPGIVVASSKHGREIGGFIDEWSRRDGFATLHDCPYSPPAGQGMWEPTPPGYRNAIEPCWGRIRPFVIPSARACDPGAPPAYSTQASSPFFHEAKEVYDVVNDLTPEQLAIATFWSDDPGTTGTPPGHSIMIAAQVVEQQNLPLDVAAETFARVGIAVADAFVACWWTKFQYNLLRPITYVHDVLGDRDWTSPLVTPPFPEYASGHSVQSAATARVLTDMFGDLAFTDHTHDVRGLPPRSFDSFLEAAEEAAISRLYGGIHFRSAIERGLDQGQCVGSSVSALRFRRLKP
jgi:hypothetical protein